MSDQPKTAEATASATSTGGTAETPPNAKKDVLLSVDPERATFLPTGSRSEHMVVNLGENRLAVKVRCSDNALYRVNPVYMLIDQGQCQNLMVTRLPGEAKVDKLVLHYVPCDEKTADARDAFKTPDRKPEMAKILMSCLAPEDAPAVGQQPPPALAEK
ncbi:Major sperm protein [Aphelenchoides fujianensis]|nr:Major sperm protein [Aphelenchoides fujianensis]KAI6185167.1 Major sperm protein [Aphelenchoides fujianensis]